MKAFGLLAVALPKSIAQSTLCYGNCTTDGGGMKSCTYTSKLDLHAGEFGYFYFEECGDMVNPTLGIEKDVTYYFVQSDITNWYHALGWAYYPDGAHDDVDELEPGIVPPGSSSTCDSNNSCPAPMYIREGEYLGQYSNNEVIAPITDSDDFGLDFYEPEFFLGPLDWTAAGTYEVALKFDVDDFTDDIFYFCHIHQYMSGRMKFVDSAGNALNAVDSPPLGYEYDVISAYDESCGTYDLNDYQLPHVQCPSQFVCDKPGSGTSGMFAGCVESMNCAMTVGMTTNMHMDDPVALFLHQMIPHHQNAVNMCKALYATEVVDCEDVEDEDDTYCAMALLCLEIINVQNFQIQTMRGVLDEFDYAAEDDCEVAISDNIFKKTKAPKMPKVSKMPKISKSPKYSKAPKGSFW